MSDSTRRKRSYPHGTAIDAEQIKDDIASDAVGAADLGGSQISDMFVTMVRFGLPWLHLNIDRVTVSYLIVIVHSSVFFRSIRIRPTAIVPEMRVPFLWLRKNR